MQQPEISIHPLIGRLLNKKVLVFYRLLLFYPFTYFRATEKPVEPKFYGYLTFGHMYLAVLNIYSDMITR